MKVIAIVVAAGKSERFGGKVRKPYVLLSGKPMLVHSLEKLEKCKVIREVIIVVNSEDMKYCKTEILEKFNFKKVKKIICGGEKRQDSVYNGLKAISQCDIVLIHDAARPFLDLEMINDSIKSAVEYGAAIVAIPITDTVKRSEEGKFVSATLDRNKLWAAQTPQVFRMNLLLEAYENAKTNGLDVTDDAGLLQNSGHKAQLVMGNYKNFKITTQEDLKLAEALINGNL
ncbi:MAG: 2-C-methyl-D-erythritol 4-phosphate cytidylyltransferase [Candidatus Firestonebacteria bacterium]